MPSFRALDLSSVMAGLVPAVIGYDLPREDQEEILSARQCAIGLFSPSPSSAIWPCLAAYATSVPAPGSILAKPRPANVQQRPPPQLKSHGRPGKHRLQCYSGRPLARSDSPKDAASAGAQLTAPKNRLYWKAGCNSRTRAAAAFASSAAPASQAVPPGPVRKAEARSRLDRLPGSNGGFFISAKLKMAELKPRRRWNARGQMDSDAGLFQPILRLARLLHSTREPRFREYR